MVESRLSHNIINPEYESINISAPEIELLEDLEPVNQFTLKELIEEESKLTDFKTQIEEFSNDDIYTYGDEYLENLITIHLDDEKNFSDMIESIAEEECFQDYIEERVNEMDFMDLEYCDYSDSLDEDDFYLVEYPAEKEIFDDLGDSGYMDQGIFEGANTDYFEEDYHEKYQIEDDSYHKSLDFIDINNFPDDLIIEEPANDNLEELIEERLSEENHLDKIFVEIIQKEDCFD